MAEVETRTDAEALLLSEDTTALLVNVLRLWTKEKQLRFTEALAARCGYETARQTPEGCKLVAHDTGDGWYLGVEDDKGNEVAMLDWPKAWPESMSASRLREIGFEVI
jgi:hypothetical protein